MRTTSGNSIAPPVRHRYRPTCVISWSRHGYENASYCISQTGRQPAMQSPTAVPRIPASASGVSTQRSCPYLSRRPAVARKTPPARPTSSPITITDESRPSSTWKASLIASTSVSSLTEDPPQLGEVVRERRRRIDVRVLEQERRVGGRFRLGSRDPFTHRLRRLGARRFGELVREHAEPSQVRVVAADALALLFLLDAFEVDVRPRVVGRRVWRGPVRHGLDERWPLAGARALGRLARRFVHGAHVRPTDAHPGNAVADRLGAEGLGRR